MPWLLLLIAAALFMVALNATSMAIVILCVLASLGLSVFAIMGLLAQRVGNSARSETMLIDPMELRRLREQAEAKRAQAAGSSDAALFVPMMATLSADSTSRPVWNDSPGAGDSLDGGGSAGGGGGRGGGSN